MADTATIERQDGGLYFPELDGVLLSATNYDFPDDSPEILARREANANLALAKEWSAHLIDALHAREWDLVDLCMAGSFYALDMQPEDFKPPIIYYLQAESGPIKIGTTRQPKARFAVLRSSHPEPLTVLRTHIGGFQQEAELHARFAYLRLHGEWFTPGNDLLEHIETADDMAPVGSGLRRVAWWTKQGQTLFGKGGDLWGYEPMGLP